MIFGGCAVRIKIIADSTMDLSPQLIKTYSIRCVPLTIVMGSKDYKDGVDITPKSLFAFVDGKLGSSHT
jgi:fatty acid-binding protein DegV